MDKSPNIQITHDFKTAKNCLIFGLAVGGITYLFTHRAAGIAAHNAAILTEEFLKK